MKQKLPSPVTLLILTGLTTVVWVSLSVYRTYTLEAPPSVPDEVSQELTPTLNKDVINDIKQRQFYNEVPAFVPPQQETATPKPSSQPTTEPTVTVEPTASGSATLEENTNGN